MSDLNNVDKPIRIGNAVARGGDFDCLDWNKKVSHILATGSSEGFVTVWDVKTKKESLTLNNYSRKPASAVAWDPEKVGRWSYQVFDVLTQCLEYQTCNGRS